MVAKVSDDFAIWPMTATSSTSICPSVAAARIMALRMCSCILGPLCFFISLTGSAYLKFIQIVSSIVNFVFYLFLIDAVPLPNNEGDRALDG